MIKLLVFARYFLGFLLWTLGLALAEMLVRSSWTWSSFGYGLLFGAITYVPFILSARYFSRRKKN